MVNEILESFQLVLHVTRHFMCETSSCRGFVPEAQRHQLSVKVASLAKLSFLYPLLSATEQALATLRTSSWQKHLDTPECDWWAENGTNIMLIRT